MTFLQPHGPPMFCSQVFICMCTYMNMCMIIQSHGCKQTCALMMSCAQTYMYICFCFSYLLFVASFLSIKGTAWQAFVLFCHTILYPYLPLFVTLMLPMFCAQKCENQSFKKACIQSDFSLKMVTTDHYKKGLSYCPPF